MNDFHLRLLNKQGQRGFSIVEILAALMLVVLVFALITVGPDDGGRAKLDETLSDLRRAVRFANNESILRNSIVRISIDLAAQPQEYYIEYSTEGGLALPDLENPENLSFSEREEQAKKLKDLNSQFSKISEFSEENKKLPEEVTVAGVATASMDDIVRDGKAYIYFYPTGEKDASLIFLSTIAELATLDIPAFENTTFSDYSTYSEYDLRNLDQAQENKMKEIRDEWLTK